MLWLVTLAWLLFALTWAGLHWVIVPRIGEWRPALESMATQAFGVRVTVGAIRADAAGAIPAFELRDVRLYNAQGREALYLPRVLSALSVQSLWRAGFEQLVIERPVLDIRRRADGHVEVAGIDVSDASAQDGSKLVDWLFSQAEVAIRQGELRWQDDTRPQAPALVLRDVDLVARNPGRQHLLRLDATPPPEWGQRFSLRARMSQPLWQTDASQWRDWSGTLYGDFAAIDLRQLRQHVDVRGVLGMEVLQGQGALRCWADVRRGQLAGVTSDVALDTVAVRLGAERSPLALRDLRTRLDVRQAGPAFELATQGLAFHTGNGLAWPGGNVRYSHVRTEGGGWQQLRLQTDRIDLLTVQQLAQHLPLQADAQHWLTDLQPRGLVQSLDVQWQSNPRQPDDFWAGRWQAKGQVQRLGVQPGSVPEPAPGADGALVHDYGRPGLSGADITFDLTQDGGRADLQLRDGTLAFPGVFEEPVLPFQRLQAQVTWEVKGQDIHVEVPKLSFANADAEGSLSGDWRTSAATTAQARERFPGVLTLNGVLSRGDGARVYRYLPQDVAASVRQYVREAVRQGRAQDVKFELQGNLNDFPFEQPGTGNFQVKAQLRDVALAYVPPYLNAPDAPAWPALEQVQADFLIDRATLHISRASGGVTGAPQLRASQAEALIPNFMLDEPQLQVRAQVGGPAVEALAFVNRSPLARMTGEALRDARIAGAADVQFQLDVPLEQVEGTRVQGQVKFAGNDVRVSPDSPWLEGARGVLAFTERGFSLGPSTARLLGGELRFSGNMVERAGASVIRFQGQGMATAEGMRNARDWGLMAQLGQHVSGSTPYQVKLEVADAGLSVQVDSSLQGLALNLPAPLAKSAAQAWPLRYAVQPLPIAKPGVAGGSGWDRLSLEVGGGAVPVLSALYERRAGVGAAKVVRGALALRSERPSLPTSGVLAHLALGELDMDAWARAWTPLGGAASASSGPEDRSYWPTAFKLEAQRLAQDGRSFHGVQARGTREQDNWRLNVTARELEGYLEYRPGSANDPGRLHARLDRLSLPPAQTHAVEALMPEQPTQMPTLDIVVNQFELGARALGRLEVEAVNRVSFQGAGEAVREWRLSKLNLAVPEARLEATGNWATLATARTPGGSRRTALNLRLAVTDSGALLERFGMPGVVRGGKGQIEGTLGWLGSPLDLHYPSLGGQLKLNVERGQFLKADPGLAKLLGVLSLQALPRRLTLDFRDVFSDGFAFDFVRGDARIEQGVASTNNLQMKGVNAAVLLEGSADVARETQDVTVVVIPELNAGTAALVATAINPAVGLGSFLAQYLIGKPLLQAATTQRFRITGPWADPQVEKLGSPRNIDSVKPPSSGQGAKP